MTAPSPLLAASTERLAAALYEVGLTGFDDAPCKWDALPDPAREHYRRKAARVIASGAVVPVASLADDEALVEQAAEDVTDAHWCESNYTHGCNCREYRTREARSVLRALAAALEDR